MGRDPNVRIFKYALTLQDRVEIVLPLDSTVLCIQTQKGLPYLWVKVRPDLPGSRRVFYIVGTGHPMPIRAGQYVGTFQLEGGSLIFHVFEEE